LFGSRLPESFSVGLCVNPWAEAAGFGRFGGLSVSVLDWASCGVFSTSAIGFCRLFGVQKVSCRSIVLSKGVEMILGLRNKVFSLLFVLGMSLTLGVGVLQASEAGHSDPTHSNASSEMANPLELRTDFAIFSLLVFLALLAVLYALAWKPLMKGLDLREQLIAGQVEEARAASEQAALKLKEYEAKLADAAVQAQAMVVQAKRDSELVAERIKTEAQSNAERMLDRARSEIETAKQSALSELSLKSTEIAFGLARKVIGRELKSSDHEQLVKDALGRLPNVSSSN
jgi:F-type H+-transporting ATPase subunit b